MPAVSLAPPPIQQVFNNLGVPNANGSILTQVGGVNTATYQDSGGTIPLPNPIPLNSRGEISNAAGASCQLFLQNGIVYTFTYFDAAGNQINQATYVTPTLTLNAASQLSYTPLGTGAVVTTIAAKLQQIISVVDRGADPTGTADSTTAVSNAAASNTLVWFPKGTYKLTNLVLTSLVNFGLVAQTIGGVNLTTTATGSMVKISTGCNFGQILGLNFSPTGSPAGSSGLELTSTAGNIEVHNCVFSAWTSAGLKATGVIGTQMSGHKIYNCYFLQNAAGAASTGQLDLTYSNDMMIAGNQIGGQLSGPFSTYGVQMTNCNNCNYGPNNFVWENGVGGNFNTCAYLRVHGGNRFEQSQNEGAIFTSLVASQILGNWFNNNGLAATNTYNHMRLISASNTLVQGNNFWDWSGGVNSQKYALSVETGMTRCTIRNNQADKYATGAYQFASAIAGTSNQTDGSLKYSSGGTVGSGTTTYLMPGGGTTATAGFALQFPDSTHTIVQIVATCTGAPTVGQTFTYTLMKNGVSTGLSAVISGAAVFQVANNASTVIEDTANNVGYQVQLVTSAGAASVAHNVSVIYITR